MLLVAQIDVWVRPYYDRLRLSRQLNNRRKQFSCLHAELRPHPKCATALREIKVIKRQWQSTPMFGWINFLSFRGLLGSRFSRRKIIISTVNYWFRITARSYSNNVWHFSALNCLVMRGKLINSIVVTFSYRFAVTNISWNELSFVSHLPGDKARLFACVMLFVSISTFLKA